MCGSNSNTLRLASSMGTEVFSSIIDEAAPDFLGFDHEEAVDALINGDGTLPTETQNVSTDIGESTSAEPSSGGGGSTTTTTTSSPPINDMFPPFGFPGTALFEKQTFQGTEYEWRSERIGLFGDRGTDNGTWMRVNTNTTQTNSTTSNLPIGNITMGNSYSGGKIICGELYRQGFLSEEVWEADQRFGKELYLKHTLV